MHRLFFQMWYQIFPPSIPLEFDFLLTAYSEYYRDLDYQNKQRFLKRLALLLKFIRFIPKDLPNVTAEMKIIIGSAIIQITFGIDTFLMRHFERIYVMPRMYRFRNFKEPFLGHVDFKEKVICFSWEDVQTGFQIPDDAVNVALHEMAHVWEMEHKIGGDFQKIFNQKDWHNWEAVAEKKLKLIQNGEHKFLKSYGGKNMKELFAVCVEAFFEQSEAFYEQLPELYFTMVNLLQQDPMNKKNPLKKAH